jgi:predicted  nucleic acid-binding Zn-ribbon protein
MSSHGSLQSPGDTDTPTRSKLSAGASDLSKQIVGLKMMTDTLNDEIDELKEQIEATQSQLQASDAHNIELADANKQLETVSHDRRV